MYCYDQQWIVRIPSLHEPLKGGINKNNLKRTIPVEWPTLFIGIVIHAAWAAATIAAGRLPWWGMMPLGGFLVAWHGSFQHETIHGHPTRSRAFNTFIASLPLGLWMPYGVYRAQHLAHHRTGSLTDPIEDPESFYVTKEQWERAHVLSRAILWVNVTLAGRLTVGPILTIMRFVASEMRRIVRRDFSHARAWATHLAGVALVIAWLDLVCGVPLWRYALCFVYPGLALTLLRSFAEHRPASNNAQRVAIVEAGPLASLLYLNNNLHVVHHDEPQLPWYELPARYRVRRSEVLARNHGHLFSGYGALLARFGLRPKDAPVHPEYR